MKKFFILMIILYFNAALAVSTTTNKPYFHVLNNSDIPVLVWVYQDYCWSTTVSARGGHAVYQPNAACQLTSQSVQVFHQISKHKKIQLCNVFPNLTINSQLVITGNNGTYQCNVNVLAAKK